MSPLPFVMQLHFDLLSCCYLFNLYCDYISTWLHFVISLQHVVIFSTCLVITFRLDYILLSHLSILYCDYILLSRFNMLLSFQLVLRPHFDLTTLCYLTSTCCYLFNLYCNHISTFFQYVISLLPFKSTCCDRHKSKWTCPKDQSMKRRRVQLEAEQIFRTRA